jgi:hypothetical protein
MNEANSIDDDLPTLDPPGTIAIVGAGPLGIEAALYGRFLGYDVTLIEADSVGSSMVHQGTQPLSILPDRCLSPLALAALAAQRQDSIGWTLPLTVEQWVHEALVPLTESDLLQGRLVVAKRVTRIVPVPVEAEAAGEPDEHDESIESIPPDFRLTLAGADGVTEFLDAEAVVLAVGPHSDIELGFAAPAPYYFRIGQASSEDWEANLLSGHREIVEVYAQLAGRADLDLYRPKRV